MPGQENVRDRAAIPIGRFRILRMLKKTSGKRFFFHRRVIPEHAGYKTDRCVNQGLCRDLAAGQYEVTQRHFLNTECVDHALIDAFEAAADQGDALRL